MIGMVNRAMQCFVQDTYGQDTWRAVMRAVNHRDEVFELLLEYDDALTEMILAATSRHLGKRRREVLEDMGTYIVTHPTTQSIRRLLRFGGNDFVGFLCSLDDLPDRIRLAVPDIEVPTVRVRERAPDQYALLCGGRPAVSAHLLVGLLRAMADDYGVLACVELSVEPEAIDGPEPYVIDVTVICTSFSADRGFRLEVRPS